MYKCEVCGGPLPQRDRYKFPSQRPRTCSRSCGMKLAYQEKRATPPNAKKPPAMCQNCGQEIKGSSPRACSRSCGVRLALKEGRWHAPKNGSGPANTNWGGGRRKLKAGYIEVLAPDDHPVRSKGKRYMMEHRVVMEKHLGRYLDDSEKVHHRNGVKDDNRIENLEIVTHARPNGWVICPHCRKSFQVH